MNGGGEQVRDRACDLLSEAWQDFQASHGLWHPVARTEKHVGVCDLGVCVFPWLQHAVPPESPSHPHWIP